MSRKSTMHDNRTNTGFRNLVHYTTTATTAITIIRRRTPTIVKETAAVDAQKRFRVDWRRK
jgi:hypothetical protein